MNLKTAPHNVDGCLLSDEEYGRQRMALLKEKAALEELLQDGGQGVEKWLELSEKSFDFASTARSRFSNGNGQTKKEILAAVGSNLILKDKKLSIQAPEPSEADIKVTRDLIRAGQLLKIEVLDHVIVGHPNHCSLREMGYVTGC